MKLETFKAPTMAEALAMVKKKLGPQAVILHTRTLNEGGVLGYTRKRWVEITAAKDGFSLSARQPGASVIRRSETVGDAKGAAEVTPRDTIPASSASMMALSRQVASLDSAVKELLVDARQARLPRLTDELRQAYRDLVAQQVAEDIAETLVRRIRSESPDANSHDVRARLADYIRSMLPVAEPIDIGAADSPAVLAFVGATGVGKTTTVAKLAADARLKQNRTVGLITTDTHRIAAHEQLRTYAEIIDVPLHTVASPKDMRKATAALREYDLLLIDTAGISPKNTEKQGNLKVLLEAADVTEVHLVLPATGSADALAMTIDRFSPLGVNRLLFTKLDEAVGFGVILNCLRRTEAKLSYVTDGQRVPDDIHRGAKARIAESIVGPSTDHERELKTA